MATVAEAPAGDAVNREGALMVAAVNGTIGPQSFPALYRFDQVAGWNEVNHFSSLGRPWGDGHMSTSSQTESRCLRSFSVGKASCCRRWRRRTSWSSMLLGALQWLKMMVSSGIIIVTSLVNSSEKQRGQYTWWGVLPFHCWYRVIVLTASKTPACWWRSCSAHGYLLCVQKATSLSVIGRGWLIEMGTHHPHTRSLLTSSQDCGNGASWAGHENCWCHCCEERMGY